MNPIPEKLKIYLCDARGVAGIFDEFFVETDNTLWRIVQGYDSTSGLLVFGDVRFVGEFNRKVTVIHYENGMDVVEEDENYFYHYDQEWEFFARDAICVVVNEATTVYYYL